MAAVRKPANRKLTHLDDRGQARMVDVGRKEPSERTAKACGRVRMSPETLRALQAGETPKGDVLAVARIAGIQAAKRTADLIPMCHQVQLTSVKVELAPEGADTIAIEATARAADRTGVEMEALTAVSVAALTLYDMLKAIDRGIVIDGVMLLSKTGGVHGDYVRGAAREARKDERRSASSAGRTSRRSKSAAK